MFNIKKQMIMKKTYINPTLEVVKIQTVGMLAGSLGQNDTSASVNGSGEYTNQLGRDYDFDDED